MHRSLETETNVRVNDAFARFRASSTSRIHLTMNRFAEPCTLGRRLQPTIKLSKRAPAPRSATSLSITRRAVLTRVDSCKLVNRALHGARFASAGLHHTSWISSIPLGEMPTGPLALRHHLHHRRIAMQPFARASDQDRFPVELVKDSTFPRSRARSIGECP
jgi:hypothetical protein